MELNGFSAFSLPGLLSTRGGRVKGGLVTLISTRLRAIFKKLDPLDHLATAVQVQWRTHSLLLINVYLPPQREKRLIRNTWAQLEQYLDKLSNQFPDASVVVAGDLNARTGQSDEALYAHFHETAPIIEEAHSIPARISKDKGCNYAGLCLLHLVNKLDLVILNGRTEGEKVGEFTFISNNGASTIDYIIVSYDLQNKVLECKVEERLDSDHLPLSALVVAGKDLSCAEKIEYSSPTALELRYSRIRWTDELHKEISSRLCSKEFLTKRDNLITSSSHELKINLFQELISLLQDSLKEKRNRSNRQSSVYKISKPWFDQECQDMKLNLLKKYKKYRSANLPQLPTVWFEDKRNYKILIKNKKLLAQKREWKCLIDASRERDSATFWRMVANGVRSTSSEVEYTIPAGTWEAFFQSLYSALPLTQPLTQCAAGDEWPPVTVAEVRRLIQALKYKKAPGADNISPELLKANIDWWAPVLATLFTSIDQTAIIPEDWGLAIIVPIFKKGCKLDPANYRPISLLSIISKLYATHLREKFADWLEWEHILKEAQAGFRAHRSTLDQGLVLQHLAEKYTSKKGGSLYVAFIDFKSAFDLIPRHRLWEKLSATNIDRRLLLLIRRLHENTRIRVRCDRYGNLSKEIQSFHGVKQGCVLAPILFNFYINSLVRKMEDASTHPPNLNNIPIPVLLYADDAALISFSCVGLRKLLRALTEYCEAEHLIINYTKSKIMVFSKRKLRHKWKINNQPIEQVTSFRYLGIIFDEKGSWCHQIKNSIANAQRSSRAIISFFYRKGGQYVPAASQVFVAKILPQLMYGTQIFNCQKLKSLESVQTKFYRSLLGLPTCVSNTAIRLEVGQLPINARIWILKIHFWLKLIFFPVGVAPLTLLDPFQSKWRLLLYEKLKGLGLSPQELIASGFEKAKRMVSQRIGDVELQDHMSKIDKYPAIQDYGKGFNLTPYLLDLQIAKYRRAFTLTRFDVLPSALLKGRYVGKPYAERVCPCGLKEVETASHVLLHCDLYGDIRSLFISPIVQKFPGRSESQRLKILLGDKNPEVTLKVAKFSAAAIKRRALAVKK